MQQAQGAGGSFVPTCHCPRCTVPISRLASPRIQPNHCLRNLRMHAIAPRFGVSATQARSQGARACSSRMSRYSEKLCRRVPTRARWGKCWRCPPRLVVRAYQISSSLLTGFYLVGAHLPRRRYVAKRLPREHSAWLREEKSATVSLSGWQTPFHRSLAS